MDKNKPPKQMTEEPDVMIELKKEVLSELIVSLEEMITKISMVLFPKPTESELLGATAESTHTERKAL